MLHPLVSLIFFVAMTADTSGQAVLIPAPAVKLSPAYRCRLRDENRHIYAGRDLDAQGQFLSESIQWTDGHVGDRSVVPGVVLNWRSENGHQTFENGMTELTFHSQFQLTGPLQLSFSGPDGTTTTLDAGTGGDVNSHSYALSYVRIGQLLKASPQAANMHWRLEKLDGYRGKPVALYKEGDLDLAFFRAAQAEFPALIQRLDALQAQYSHACTRI
jgi:hypothetical protein